MGEEAETAAPSSSNNQDPESATFPGHFRHRPAKTGSTRSVSAEHDSSTASPAAQNQHNTRNDNDHGDVHDHADIIRHKVRSSRGRGPGGMSTFSSSLLPASFIVHKRYILPTLLLVFAVGAVTSAEEWEILREPLLQQPHSRYHRQQQQPLDLDERPVRDDHRRRRHHVQPELGSSSSRAPSRDLNEGIYNNSTSLDGAHQRRDANLTVGR